MRLADFILRNLDTIVAEWEAFAATQLPAARTMTPLALRDHAHAILEAVAADLVTPQTPEAQAEKSKGRAPQRVSAPQTAAQTHAILRAQSGFDINQLAAEYRALRASVIRLWLDSGPHDDLELQDLIRFNEAIDQALAESIGFFSAQVDRARNLFLGMLGHDLRSPLQAIQMTASYLAALNTGEHVSRAAARLIHSGARMKALLDDLVDFNQIRLGLGIPIAPTPVDLAALLAEEVEQWRAAHPTRRLELEVVGNTQGCWDGRRLQQVLGNLLSNAIRYGAPDAPVRVGVTGAEAELRVEVKNAGPAIEPATLEQIFDPLTRGPARETSAKADGSLGLGLYIVHEIVKAHGGEIHVRSDRSETVFAVRLPRHPECS